MSYVLRILLEQECIFVSEVSVSVLLDRVKQIAVANKQGLSEIEVIRLAKKLFCNDYKII